MAWICSMCKLNNSPWNKQCANWLCKSERIDWYSSLSSTGWIYDAYTENRIEQMDDAKVELHARFFNAEMMFVADMSDEQLEERRAELSNIIFEARARYNAADETSRTRRAKKGDKSWLVTPEIGPNVTERIDLPKERAKRQSRADKLLETMKSLGVENPEELIKNVERASTKAQVDSISFNKKPTKPEEQAVLVSELCRIGQHESCPGRFTDDNGSHECGCSHHKESTPVIEPKRPFDPSELF